MSDIPETIVAIASPPGRGAIGIIRLSGALVPLLAPGLIGRLPAPRVAARRRFMGALDETLDEGLALYFPAPASFTGEHVLELQGHGGSVVLERVLRRAIELGCRMARPGEFSERAYLNGKIDLAQAEAVADLIDAASEAAARAAMRSLQGVFSERVRALQGELTELRVYVEAAIDFPDEEIDFLSDTRLRDRVARLFAAFDAITVAARQGALLRDGLNVVIAGKPNAGKSSLLNRMVGDAVAIVTPLPGTTRDVLRHSVHLDGMPVNLIDTAGLRAASDLVEQEGIRRAHSAIRRADHVLYVVDAATEGLPPSTARPEELAGLPVDVGFTVVVNKIDLIDVAAHVESADGVTRVFLCAETGAGVDGLRQHLKIVVGYGGPESGVFSARRRHLDALDRAQECARRAAEALESDGAVELFAEELRLAQLSLGEITGEVSSEELLGQIFGSFCIGK